MSSSDEPSPLFVKTVQAFAPAILWIGRTFLRWNRLDHIDMVELETPISDVIELYGEPVESKPDEDFTEATCHTFSAGPFHEAVISEWNGKACSITYWSAYSAPTPDLKHMLETYGKGIGWNDVETGYWYFRKDDGVRLWCSAIPAIGVATTQYLKTAGAAKRAKQERNEGEQAGGGQAATRSESI
jgi:hypothetical protein